MAGNHARDRRGLPFLGLSLRLLYSVALLLNASCDNGNNPVVPTSTERERVSWLVITTGGQVLAPGQSVTLTATVTSIEGRVLTDRPVSWSVSHPALASITGMGLTATMRAQSTGDLQVTARVEGVSATLNFSIASTSAASSLAPQELPRAR